MNGDYVISATPNAPKGETFNTKYAEYDKAGVEYFDVYMGPITHRYSEVFWTSLPETPVPADIVKRFAGKGMAITGYEVDQVMRKGEEGGCASGGGCSTCNNASQTRTQPRARTRTRMLYRRTALHDDTL